MGEHRSIPISLPSVGADELASLEGPIGTGWLTQGPKVAEFERRFAERHGVSHAVAVTSCTTALQLALVALGVGPGDEVIVPAFTWVATANVVVHCGATPVLVDVDPATYNLDPEQLAAKLTERTRGVIVVHLFGLCADVDRVRELLPDDVWIVEDAACAAGATYRGRSAGSLGRAGAFSFHPRKVMTTGEGGMLTTQDEALAARTAVLRNHGASIAEEVRHSGPKPFLLPDFDIAGFNFRMTDLQGAVGLSQLGKLDAFLSERQCWADFYRRELAELEWLRLPAVPEDGDQHGWQAFVCSIDRASAPIARDDLMEALANVGVSTRPGTHAIHLLGYYQDRFAFAPDEYPGARDCHHDTMAIPLHNRMTADDYGYVVESLRRFD